MRRLGPVLFALLLAGCGGRSAALPPASATAATAAPAAPRAPAAESLYVTDGSSVFAFPGAANGPTAPRSTIGGFTGDNAEHVLALVTTGRGQLGVVQNAGATPRAAACNVIVHGPAANGAQSVPQTFSCGVAAGEAIGRGAGTQLDVFGRTSAGTKVVNRFENGASAGSFALATPAGGFTTDAEGNLYVVAGASRVDEYAAHASSGAAPLRSITFNGASLWGALAVAPDGTLYAVSVTQDSTTAPITAYVHAVAPGQSAPSRTIGPFTDGAIVPVAALACDAAGDLYVALNAYPSGTKVDAFAPDADGAAVPRRSLPDPVPAGARIQAIALGT